MLSKLLKKKRVVACLKLFYVGNESKMSPFSVVQDLSCMSIRILSRISIVLAVENEDVKQTPRKELWRV